MKALRNRAVLLLAIATLLTACHKPANSIGDFSFVKQNGESELVTQGTNAHRATATHTASGAHGVDVFGVPEAGMPAGMHSQVMRFRFRSRGFFTQEPGAHVDLGLTGAWRKDDPATPVHEGLLVGRGIIIGNVSQAQQGCAGARMIQIEAFYRRGNRLFGDSCSPPLQEQAWYSLSVVAGSNGQIGYVLRDAWGEVLARHLVHDLTDQVPADLGGWWIGHVFSNSNVQADWAVDFAGLEVYWLAEPVSEALLQDL